MFVSKLRGGKSHRNKFQVESLEQRQLLSTVALLSGLGTQYPDASVQTYVLEDYNEDGTVNALDFSLLASEYGATLSPITTLATKLLKLEGAFSGHYTSTTTGTHAITFDITSCTHTGHFTGTAEFTNDQGKFPATVKGAISASHHIDLSYSGADFSGTMTGNATHTNGSFSGDYANTTGPVSHGTYHVAKA
jgi:hypothetical protein